MEHFLHTYLTLFPMLLAAGLAFILLKFVINSKSDPFVLFSLIALSAVITFYQELFFFQKSVILPNWTNYVPAPAYTSSYIALILLSPAALYSVSLKKSIQNTINLITYAPIFALLIRLFDTYKADKYYFINLVYQYLWIVAYSLLIPSFLLLALRFFIKNLHAKD